MHFQSANFPDRVLRHQNFRIKLDEFAPVLDPGVESPENQLLRADCSFKLMHALDVGALTTDAGAVTFQSINFPDRYIRHRDFHLFLEPHDGSSLFKEHATFLTRSGFYQPHI